MKLGFESWVICRTHSHPRCVVWLCKLQKTGVYGIIKVGPATVTTVTAVTTTTTPIAVIGLLVSCPAANTAGQHTNINTPNTTNYPPAVPPTARFKFIVGLAGILGVDKITGCFAGLVSQMVSKEKVIRTTNVIVYSLLTAVIVVQQQVLWGAYFLRPGPQKPPLPRGLSQERAAVAAVF